MNLSHFYWFTVSETLRKPGTESQKYQSEAHNFLHQEYGSFIFRDNNFPYSSIYEVLLTSHNRIWPITAILISSTIGKGKRLI